MKKLVDGVLMDSEGGRPGPRQNCQQLLAGLVMHEHMLVDCKPVALKLLAATCLQDNECVGLVHCHFPGQPPHTSPKPDPGHVSGLHETTTIAPGSHVGK